MQPRPQNRAPERLSQVFVTIQLFYTAVFHTGVLLVSSTPNGCESMPMSPTGVFLTCPCRCLFYRLAPMQVCTTQVFFHEGLPIWVGPEPECLIPPCLHASCVSTPVRSYRRHRNPRGSFLLHFRASYFSALQDWVPVTGAHAARPHLPPGSAPLSLSGAQAGSALPSQVSD